jgi:outer membrane autotransporter protein
MLVPLSLAALPAHAVPGAFTGAPIQIDFAKTPQALVNLRTQGVITGTSPLRVSVGQITVNGNPSQQTVSVFAFGEGANVCLSVQATGFDPARDTDVQVELTVSSNRDEAPETRPIQIAQNGGPLVDLKDTSSCFDNNQTPVANAGAAARTVADTDGKPGENVTLDGSASVDPDGAITNYQWTLPDQEQTLGNGPSPTLIAALPDGVHRVVLTVTDDSGDSETGISSQEISITVGAPVPTTLTANAGPDQSVKDTDGQAGENVTLNGSASATNNPQFPIATYVWTSGETELGRGTTPTLTTRLPDGVTVVQLTITDTAGRTSSDTVQVTIAAKPAITKLEDLPNLSAKQLAMARGIDGVCGRIFDLANSEGSMNAQQQDLLAKCNGLLIGNSAVNQIEALDELAPDDFAVARTQTLLFANTQYASVMDRLMALRGGAKGLSLAGLNIIVEGKIVPLAQLQKMAEQVLGGGASADDEPGGLLSDKWGLWARGNYSFGDKKANSASPSFDADQWALVGGIDYRLTDKSVIGASLAYGDSSVKFNPHGEGALDTTSWAVSLYGSVYAAKNFYFDGILNVANSSYDADRNITYVDGAGLVSADAQGETDGLTVSGGLSAGYDFLIGGLTLSPNVGLFYIDAKIDGFTEEGAGGLNLLYDEQKFKSFTGNAGVRLTYAWNLSWGVLLPHVRIDYVREFENDADVFGVRFAADPNATSTPPILVQTDNPDESYWRLAAGFSAQFKYGISGYVEYQRLEGFQFISFQDVSVGLRLQRSF